MSTSVDGNHNVIDLCSSDDDIETELPTSSSRSSSPSGKHKRKLDDSQHQSPEMVPLLLFIESKDGGDNCIVTEGLMDLLQARRFSNAVTCRAVNDCENKLPLLHIHQSDKFSCGYRNMQMLLTALLPLLPLHHSFYRLPPCSVYTRDAGHIKIPNLTQLQQLMEQAWADGFDPKGAQFYSRKIVGKKSQIGAVEVSYTFLYLGIDCCVVQFTHCPESRSQLGPFCAAYFSKQFCPDCTKCSELKSGGSYDAANHILRNLSSQCGARNHAMCRCPSFPLYLQYNGHSVTVIGVEMFANSDKIENLLLFDPIASGSMLAKALSENDIKPFRRSLSSLQARDCQIVLVSTKFLSASEQERLKRGYSHILTAAEDSIR